MVWKKKIFLQSHLLTYLFSGSMLNSSPNDWQLCNGFLWENFTLIFSCMCWLFGAKQSQNIQRRVTSLGPFVFMLTINRNGLINKLAETCTVMKLLDFVISVIHHLVDSRTIREYAGLRKYGWGKGLSGIRSSTQVAGSEGSKGLPGGGGRIQDLRATERNEEMLQADLPA